MFRGIPTFIHTQWDGPRQRRHEARGLWWLVMAPGLGLIGAGLAIVIWPDLLAYFVASLLLCGGTALTMAGWRLRHLARQARQAMHRGQAWEPSNRDNSYS